MRIYIFFCTFAANMRKIVVFIVSILSLTLYGQTHASADKLFQAGDYQAAQQAYAALLKSYPREALYLYRYARCAQELEDYSTALQYFEKAGDRYMLKYFYIGEIYMQLWRADDAISAYNTYLQSQKQPNEREAYIQQQIAKAEKLQRYLRRVERIEVIDSVQVPIDSMLYNISLSTEAGRLTWDSLGSTIYTNERGDRRLLACAVDSTRLLVSTHRLLDEWTQPDTFPATINFTQDQRSPYLLNDGVTLYFAANDSNGLGGLDIYVSRYNMATENFTTPENIGMPYNSPANEYMLVLDETQQVGYLATDRFATAGHVHIYSFVIPERKQYWRHIAADTLAAYAQLKRYDTIEADATATTYDSGKQEVDSEKARDFSFVVNDSTIYHSLNDFSSAKAKDKYLAWVKAEEQYQAEQEELAELREEYSTADEAQQKELTPTILRLENSQSQLLQRVQTLLIEIRQIEMSAR